MIVKFDFPRTFDGLARNIVRDGGSSAFSSSYPAMDIADYEHESMVVAELPGVKKEDVKLTFEDGVLSISGLRKAYETPQDARILLNEMRERQFSRSVCFRHEVDSNNISAELEDGILRIRVPKAEQAKARTIEVR